MPRISSGRQDKGCGSPTIELSHDDPFTWDDVDRETAEMLSTVWNTYGGFSAGRLRNMTQPRIILGRPLFRRIAPEAGR